MSIFLVQEHFQHQHQVHLESIQTLAALTIEQLHLPLQAQQAKQVLQGLKTQPSITQAQIYDTQGQLISAYTATVGTSFPDLSISVANNSLINWKEQSNFITLTVPVYGKQTNPQAWLQLQLDLSSLKQGTLAYLGFVSLILLAALIFPLLINRLLCRRLNTPLLNLNQELQKILLEKNYNLRIPVADEIAGTTTVVNEVDQLVFACNQLLDKIQKTEIHVNQALSEASLAAKTKSRFLSTMSHEIRTPINGVLGMTELLLETSLNKQQKQLAKTVQQSGQSLLSILDNILDLARLEAGRLELNITEFKLDDLTASIAELHATTAQQKGLGFYILLADNLPEVLLGDIARLRQILSHLISNAIKFTDAGFIFIRVNLFKEEKERMLVAFEIEDSGIGISTHALKELFQAFSQGDSSFNRKYGGTGLGLALSRQLAEKMDGKIGAQSNYQQHKGTTFWFTAWLGKHPSRSVPPYQEHLTLAYKRILLVDTDRYQQQVLQQYLTCWDMAVDIAESNEQALEKLQQASDKTTYDVLLLQHQAEDGELNPLVQNIRKKMEWASLKIILLLEAGQLLPPSGFKAVQGWLHRPIQRQAFYRCLCHVLEEGEGQDEDTEFAHLSLKNIKLFQANVLLAEDNPVNQRVTTIMLNALGCEVDIVHNGLEAIETLEKRMTIGQVPYDLVFMDCQMPEVDGLEATRRIRIWQKALGKKVKIPIIALTAHAMNGDREQCLAVGMDDYLSKPFTKKALYQILKKWLKPATGINHDGE
ncbi:response regulator [Candidatus Venteria ishoeyi]|uniref:response regulator n=1 Tax=Candidatus Venteria ishoeyi TaxID=1899563 RepID=UPI0015A775B1|nr:response regulator [Candidatus Venteria ishoeyi]MDM8545440.1 response regulator [Candidatus Venteria ishoeyi]